ncbi:intradiol ring-cleavage dioxygenase [Cognataquiflexum rubidum]|uniref:dioxygenase family protein n=1 Tax=Cognataquiflexum rubidum TaxID=2922273 RepID=UPI001F1429AA|nr:intradiol ring-cleavage dioxygenase [Cognataquiflexum rubidum]MCH6235562.1 intradiol ring-cleavage dioxygenase [Cognataquiflexum rubidum]
MKKGTLTWLLLVFFAFGCKGQTGNTENRTSPSQRNSVIGGGCDGCELMYIGIPKEINATDTSAGWYKEKVQKLLLTGTVFEPGGKTPAPNIIIYYWHTDTEGYYTADTKTDPKAKSHGRFRGWVKSDENGKYSIYTIRPAPYPNEDLPAHIHLSIKESDIKNEYYTDDVVFDDDPLLIPYMKKYPPENRAGSGIVRVLLKGNLQIAEHDIILGLNIPNYPQKDVSNKKSGLNIGEDQPSFIPFHAFGPDKGSQACPVCKYGRYHGIVLFVGNNPDWDDIKKWLGFLELQSMSRQIYLKAYFVYGNENGYSKSKRANELETIGRELNLQRTALTFVPSFSDSKREANLNKINPETGNTFIIYKNRRIVDKYLDLKANSKNFALISNSLDRSRGDFFDLDGMPHN